MKAERNLLTFISQTSKSGKKNGIRTQNRALYKCECGNIVERNMKSVQTGYTKSCGCLRGKGSITHGFSTHPLYCTWVSMVGRCYNPKHPSYKRYGARGVEVCDEWRYDFMAFANWALSNGWRKGMQIDKDGKGLETLYDPEFCEVVTPQVNSRRKWQTNLYKHDGHYMTLGEIGKLYGIKYNVLWHRINRGLTIDQAIEFNKSKATSERNKGVNRYASKIKNK